MHVYTNVVFCEFSFIVVSWPFLRLWLASRPAVFFRACAYAEKYGWIARLHCVILEWFLCAFNDSYYGLALSNTFRSTVIIIIILIILSIIILITKHNYDVILIHFKWMAPILIMYSSTLIGLMYNYYNFFICIRKRYIQHVCYVRSIMKNNYCSIIN